MAPSNSDTTTLDIVVLGGILGLYLAILHGLPTPWGVPWARLVLPSAWLLGASLAFAWWRPPPVRWWQAGRRRWLGFGLVALVLVALVAMTLAWPEPTRGARAAHGGAALLLVLWVPVAEECYFRAVLLDRVTGLAGRLGSALLVSALFAMLHLPSGAHVPMFVLSLVLCAVTLLTGSVAWAVLLHVGWNALAVVHLLPSGPPRWTVAGIAAMVVVGGAAVLARSSRR